MGARLHRRQRQRRRGRPLAACTKAAGLLLPGADCRVSGHRVVRWNFQRGDGTNPRHYTFSSDPRTIRDMEARRLPAQAASPVQASVAAAADPTAEDQIGQDQASRYTPSSNLAEIRFPGRYGGPRPGIRDTLRPPRQPVLLRQDGLGWESV